MLKMKQNGIGGVAFGDIFLQEMRKYCEKQIEGIGMMPIYPLWGLTSHNVACEFFANQFKAINTCVDGELLNISFVGQSYSPNFIEKIPRSVDPCGENGEFHSFVTASPIFRSPFEAIVASKVKKEYPNRQ